MQIGNTTECHWWMDAIRRMGWLGQHFASCQNALHHIAPKFVVSRFFYSAGIGCRRVADAVWLLHIQHGATSAQGLFCAQYWTCTTAALQQTSQSIDFSYPCWSLLGPFEIFWDTKVVFFLGQYHRGPKAAQHKGRSNWCVLTSRHCRDIVPLLLSFVIHCGPYGPCRATVVD